MFVDIDLFGNDSKSLYFEISPERSLFSGQWTFSTHLAKELSSGHDP